MKREGRCEYEMNVWNVRVGRSMTILSWSTGVRNVREEIESIIGRNEKVGMRMKRK